MRLLLLLICLLMEVYCVHLNRNDVVVMSSVRKTPSFGRDRNIVGIEYISIPKAMSSMTKIVLCNLVIRHKKIKKKLMYDGDTNTCTQNGWYYKYEPRSVSWKVPNWFHRPSLIIFRDPIERFVSMYTYLCDSKRLCREGMKLREFAGKVYLSLRQGKLTPGFKNRQEVFRHIQPSFWYAYQNRNSLPINPAILYLTLDKGMNAARIRDIFLRAKVPKGTAIEVVQPIRKSFGNTLREKDGTRDEEQIRKYTANILADGVTLRLVMSSYYNDYKLLKLPLREPLRTALAIHDIHLPDQVVILSNKMRVLADNCEGPRFEYGDGRKLPRKLCN